MVFNLPSTIASFGLANGKKEGVVDYVTPLPFSLPNDIPRGGGGHHFSFLSLAWRGRKQNPHLSRGTRLVLHFDARRVGKESEGGRGSAFCWSFVGSLCVCLKGGEVAVLAHTHMFFSGMLVERLFESLPGRLGRRKGL